MIIKLPPISLYIHIPWCIKKCFYCDFHSFSIKKKNIPEKIYINHLINDLYKNLKFISNREIKSIFIGGGSPSLISPKKIYYLINEIKKITNISFNAEINMEFNPTIIETNLILEYLNSGINRISIGIQSFNSKFLETLGRIHNSYETKNATKIISSIPSINFNLDIMFGLPNQSEKESILDLQEAINFLPKHISWYQLTIEPKTFFSYHHPKLPNENLIWNMLKKGKKLLKHHGFNQYEISSFAKKGFKCKHNLNYWRYGDYLGIGCGAHSKITKQNGEIIRIIKNRKINDYLTKEEYIEKIYLINKIDQAFDYFVNSFRIFEKISKKKFLERTQLNLKFIQKQITIAISKGYLKEYEKYWITTKIGKLFLNDLLEIFLH